MTVPAEVPIVEYVGNGSITVFAWSWKMIEDSFNNVLVDNVYVTNWYEEGNTIVFITAPDSGAEIIIFRRTIIWMPEDYVAFGRFHSEKTELSVDRAIMICQERGGGRQASAGVGIVGGADLHLRLHEFDVDVVSERGTDATILHWQPDDVVDPVDPPDGSILWGGNISVRNFGTGEGASASLTLRTDLTGGDPAEASAEYDNLGIFAYTSWLDTDPSDNQYWVRVLNIGSSNPTLKIFDSANYRPLTAPFQIFGTGPVISVDTYGDTAPSTQVAIIRIDICKDASGLPDGNWASANIRLEALFNV